MLLIKDKAEISRITLKHRLLYCLTLLIICQTVARTIIFRNQFNEDSSLIFSKLLAGFAVVILPTHYYYANVCQIHASDIVLFVNGLLHHGGGMFMRNTALERMNIEFAKQLRITLAFIPFLFVFGFHWIKPCNTSLAFYWVLNECSINHANGDPFLFQMPTTVTLPALWNNFVKLVVFSVNVWMWRIGMRATAFAVAGLHILCTMSLRSHLSV